MPRLPRIKLEGAIYYVTSKGLQGQPIFRDKQDYKMYLDLLTKYKSQHKFRLYSYCLFPDRLQLLIETGDDATISNIMHDLNSLYTKYFNGRYDKKGHLFESRFRSVLVEKAQYLLEMTRHIHSSSEGLPLSVEGLESAKSFSGHPYSSYDIYVHRTQPIDGTMALDLSDEVAEVMSFLKDKDNANAYERFCLDAPKDQTEALAKKLRRGGILGSDAFVENAKSRIEQKIDERLEPARPVKSGKMMLFIIGAGVLLVTTSSVYLYVSKEKLKQQYEALLNEKEAEFAEKTKFENRSPIALAELEGTIWEIEALSMTEAGATKQKDRLHFKGGRFYSDAYLERGFKPTNISMTKGPDGLVTWETIQSNDKGETVSWRGDWRADAMKGVLSLKDAGGAVNDFSFFSIQWEYAKSTEGAKA